MLAVAMREHSSSFDIARMVLELREHIGARIRKSYQPHWEQVMIRLNSKQEGLLIWLLLEERDSIFLIEIDQCQ